MSNCPKIIQYVDNVDRDSMELPFAAAGTWVAGDLFKIDANGKWADYLASGTSNTDNGATDIVAGILTYPLTVTSAQVSAGQTFELALVKAMEIPFPATVDSPAAATDLSVTPTQAMVGDRMCIRRVESDTLDTNWANRYAAVTDKTTNGALQCVGINVADKTVICVVRSDNAFKKM